MRKFMCFVKQAESGCDYTIGCGINLIQLKSSNIDDVMIEMKDIIKNRFNFPEVHISSCTIYEVSDSFIFDVNKTYNQIEEEEKERKRILKEEKERVEYDRLKQKYDSL